MIIQLKLVKDILDLTNKGRFFLPLDATSAQARQMMQDNTVCQDVFITKTGNKDEPIKGWITNNLIIEKSELFKKVQ